MAKISVIIPYYNTKREYFESCIRSVLNQTFDDYEVIIVDDGSEADYMDCLNQVCMEDERIRVFHQNNLGVSAARNEGVLQASGEYITFVDSDDIVMPQFLERSYEIARKYDADIVYGFIKRTKEEALFEEYSDLAEGIEANNWWLKKYHIGFIYKDKDKIFGRGPYARIVKKEIANKCFFLEGVPIGEDVLWNMDVISKAEKKYLSEDIWYNYIFRDDSVTGKYDPEIMDKLMPFYSEIKNYISETEEDIFLYLNRLLRDLKRYMVDVYFGHKMNHAPFIKKWKAFNRICMIEPWKEIDNFLLFRSGNIKIRAKWVLYKIKLLYPIWMIRRK